MNREKVLTYILIIGCIAGTIFIKLYCTVPIFSNKLEDIKEVEIQIYNKGEYDIYVIESSNVIETLYNMLANMRVVKIKRWPDHEESYQKDPIRVVKFYSMKEDVELLYADKSTAIYKFIGSIDNNMDSGYIIGEHETVCKYIDNIVNETRIRYLY